jgi:type VI secretion system protein ImpH
MQRRFDPGVVEAFLRAPYEFRFFQAVRLLEKWGLQTSVSLGLDGKRPAQRRYLNSTSLSFPPSEIESAQAYDKEGMPVDVEGLSHALANGDIVRIDIVPAFYGLLGGQGALPHHYSERLVATDSLRRNPAAKAFFDIFSDRLTERFYAAWKKYRLPIQHELQPRQHYLPLLLSLAGLGHDALRNRMRQAPGAVHDDALARYAAAARQRPVSAAYLQQVLADYFGVALRVEQFVGHWYTVPARSRTILGQPGAVLGGAAHIGERIWQRNLRLRLWIGPVRGETFDDFLPGGERAAALEKLLTLLAGVTYEYEVRLVRARDDVRGCTLDEQSGGMLGWNTFLCTEPPGEDRSDAAYELHTVH